MTHTKIILTIVGLTALALLATACSPSAAKLTGTGNEAFAQQAYEEALRSYQQAQAESPALAEPFYNAANVLYREGKYEEALKELQKAASFPQADKVAQASLFNAGNSAYNTKSWEAAIELYRQALLRNPDDVDAKHNLELALQQQQQEQQQQNQDQQQQDQQNQDQQNQDQQSQDQQNQDQQSQDQQSQDQQTAGSAEPGPETRRPRPTGSTARPAESVAGWSGPAGSARQGSAEPVWKRSRPAEGWSTRRPAAGSRWPAAGSRRAEGSRARSVRKATGRPAAARIAACSWPAHDARPGQTTSGGHRRQVRHAAGPFGSIPQGAQPASCAGLVG